MHAKSQCQIIRGTVSAYRQTGTIPARALVYNRQVFEPSIVRNEDFLFQNRQQLLLLLMLLE